MSIEDFRQELYDMGYYSFTLEVASVTTGDRYSLEIDEKYFGGNYLEHLFLDTLQELEKEQNEK